MIRVVAKLKVSAICEALLGRKITDRRDAPSGRCQLLLNYITAEPADTRVKREFRNNPKMIKKLIEIVLFLLVLPIINAASIAIDAPLYIIEGESVTVNFSINSALSFNGSVYLSYTNINSTTSSVNFTNISFIGEFYNYSFSIKGALQGTYSIFANLTNSSSSLDTLNKTGTVNSSIPKIILASPSGIVSKDNTILSVNTNEVAVCKYGTTNNTYESLSNTFSNTGSTKHNQSLSGLSQGENTYYVRCQDANGYTMNESTIIKFTVDLSPTAQISLSDSSPVKVGTIEVTVVASENLENMPTLEYSFNDVSTKRQISLTGSNSNWKGYLIITEADDNKIGTFYFTATDSVGNIGTKITTDNIFVVDTTKPVSPQSVKAVSEADGSIKLSWYYDGEEADYFNIYRTTNTGISYVDFYASSNGSQQFIDKSTIDKVTYYYKVSTVDKAGNEGSLSAEVFATSINKVTNSSFIPKTEEKSDVPKVLPPNLVPKVEGFIKKIDKQLIDVNDALNQLEGKEGEKRELIKELKLIEQVNTAKSTLETLKEQLEGFKSIYATEEELEQKLNALDLEAKKIEKTTAKDVDILEKSEFLQSISKDDIENAANELFKDISFTQDEKNAYIKENEKEKDKIKVEVTVKVVSLLFLDGTKSEKSFVKKTLSYQNPETLNDVIVIETIPKTIAENVNEIEFSQKYEVLKEDPVVKFGFLKFNFEGEEIAYSLNKRINLEEVKNAKSAVLLSLNELASSNKVTGSSILSSINLGLSKTQVIFVLVGLSIIILLLAYYLFFVKDFYLFKKLKRRLRMKRIEGSINKRNELNSELTSPSNLPFSNYAQVSEQISDKDANRTLNEIYLHMKDAKAELADNLLPLFVTLNNKLEAKSFRIKKEDMTNSILVINALIDQAHGYLDNYSYTEAVKLYPKICFIYQNLSKENRAEIYERCSNLHRRINYIKPQ